jgi:hypothetical protein
MIDQVMNILSGKPKDLTKTSTTTGGSAAGTAAGQWGLDQYKNMMEHGVNAYGGPIVGAQGPNAAQNQQYNMLTGMQTGAVGSAVGNMTPQQIAAMNRSGGPGAGYMNPYQDQMLGGLQKDYGESLAMMKNRIGAGAGGANAFGSTRHGVAEGVGGAKAMDDYLRAATGIRSDSYNKGMGWMGQDQNRNVAIAQANNQANLGFGDLRRRTAQDDINNQFGRSDRFGRYGLNRQNQQNTADAFRYGEFNRQEDWMPNMMNNYMAGVSGTPWQTEHTTTSYGQGKSDLQNIIGAGIGLGGAYLMS